MTAADKFGIAFSIGFTVALIAIAMSFSTMDESAAPAQPVSTPPPPAPMPAMEEEMVTEEPVMEEETMEEETMEEEMVVEEEEPAMEEEPVMEEEAEAAPMSAEVSMTSGSATPGCEANNECYVPYEVTVGVGGTVTWTNDDTAAHTVTSGTASDGPDGTFDSSIIMGGKTFEHTFDEDGTYDYFCVVHPWMTGRVIVE